jgi:hypothetical protein
MRHLSGSVLAALVDFLTINHNRRRRINADADAIALYGHHCNANVAANHDFLARPTGQD